MDAWLVVTNYDEWWQSKNPIVRADDCKAWTLTTYYNTTKSCIKKIILINWDISYWKFETQNNPIQYLS